MALDLGEMRWYRGVLGGKWDATEVDVGETSCRSSGFGIKKGLQQRIWGKLGAVEVDLRDEGLQRWVWNKEEILAEN